MSITRRQLKDIHPGDLVFVEGERRLVKYVDSLTPRGQKILYRVYAEGHAGTIVTGPPEMEISVVVVKEEKKPMEVVLTMEGPDDEGLYTLRWPNGLLCSEATGRHLQNRGIELPWQDPTGLGITVEERDVLLASYGIESSDKDTPLSSVLRKVANALRREV